MAKFFVQMDKYFDMSMSDIRELEDNAQKHLCRCLLASWNLDQNLGETYEYALKWKINLHRFRSSEGTLTSVCVKNKLYSMFTNTKRSNSIPIIIL